MNKMYALAVLAASVGYAQPVINSANLMLNLESEAFFAETDAFDPGPAGANQTWNFSGLELTPIGGNETILPTGTPFAGTFPTSNFCNATTGESAGGYTYFKYDTQKMELLGDAFTGIGIFSFGINPKTYIEFPYTFNTVFSDTYTPDNIPFTATYDGYGTLILPFGTYHNVVRQKIEEMEQTNYIWFHANPFFPIAQTIAGGIGVMRNTAVLANKQFESHAAFEMYPNPTSDHFTVRMENFNDAAIDLYDVSGKRIASQKISKSSATLDLRDCSAGIYFVKVTAGNGQTSVQKIIKR